MNDHLILGMSIFWLVTGWLGAGFMIRRVIGAKSMRRSFRSPVPPRAKQRVRRQYPG